MAGDMAARWSEVPAPRLGRRDLLVIGAGAAAALLMAGSEPLRKAIVPAALLTPAELVRSFPKNRWGWMVELAVLHRLDTDRNAALTLLWAALELDLDPAQKWHRKPALRLYDLFAALSDRPARTALASLVRTRSTDPALLARATRWDDPARAVETRIWRTTGPDGRPLGILIARA
jgi:hypothetical protein